MARFPEQCCQPVQFIVRPPNWRGDAYHVCGNPQHIEWAKTKIPGESLVKKITTMDCCTGCVYVVGEAQLKRRTATR